MLQRLRQTRTQIEADLLISRLRAAGLHPSDLRIWPHVTLAGANLFYDVEVPAEEAEAANQVIGRTENGDSLASRPNSTRIILRIGVALVLAALALGLALP